MPTSSEIYTTWYNGLDDIDKEIVSKVEVDASDDDYPFVVYSRAKLSPTAAKRAGIEYNGDIQGYTAMYRPTPPNEYFEALLQESAERAQREREAVDEQRSKEQAERVRQEQWEKETLAGLVRTSVFPKGLIEDGGIMPAWHNTVYWNDKVVYFDTGSFTTGDSFRPYDQPDGSRYWAWTYGNAMFVYAPAEKVAEWYQREWDSLDDKPMWAWTMLDYYLGGYTVIGADFSRWLIEEGMGLEKLIEIARSRPTPKDRGGFSKARVSKAFRLPVETPDGRLGYGDWDFDENKGDGKDNILWRAWVSVGDEANARMPRQADIELYREAQRKRWS